MIGTRHGIIFGASAGVGAALASILSQRDKLTFVSRRGTVPADAVGASIRCDVRDYEAVYAAINSTSADLDYVISCVGVGYFAPFTKDNSHWWREIVGTNLNGNINILSATTRLRPNCRQIVVAGSVAARRMSRTPGNQVYRASKAALSAFLDDIRYDLRIAGSRTKICNLAPGFIEGTDFSRRFYDSEEKPGGNICGQFPGLTPEQVANVVSWVLNSESNVDISELTVRPTAQPD